MKLKCVLNSSSTWVKRVSRNVFLQFLSPLLSMIWFNLLSLSNLVFGCSFSCLIGFRWCFFVWLGLLRFLNRKLKPDCSLCSLPLQCMTYTQIAAIFFCCCFSGVLPRDDWLLRGRRYLATESVKNCLRYLLLKKPGETRCWGKEQ